MKCPLCDQNLIKDTEDEAYIEPDIYCEQFIRLNGKKFSHYRDSPELLRRLTMMILPYRIINEKGESKIGLLSRYKSGRKRYYFKTILKCHSIRPNTEEKLRNKIKLLLLMS